ncbi:hypothetical protein DFJ73DRAFT_775645 [Zopfochytrium polystomum]|nr:hypothetical protein DFJ73DRAFT_775645 [Zopfochytrium polystomum]
MKSAPPPAIMDYALRNAFIYLAAITVDRDSSEQTATASTTTRSPTDIPIHAAAAHDPRQPPALRQHPPPPSATTQRFIFDLVMRSRSSFYDVQLALFYLGRYRARTRRAAAVAAAAASSPSTDPTTAQPSPHCLEPRLRPPTPPPDFPCSPKPSSAAPPPQLRPPPPPPPPPPPRLAFLASLVLAWKHLHDDPPHARAWSRMSGEPAARINAAERAVLAAIGYRLHVDVGVGVGVGGGGGQGFAAFCGAAVQIAMGLARSLVVVLEEGEEVSSGSGVCCSKGDGHEEDAGIVEKRKWGDDGGYAGRWKVAKVNGSSQ